MNIFGIELSAVKGHSLLPCVVTLVLFLLPLLILRRRGYFYKTRRFAVLLLVLLLAGGIRAYLLPCRSGDFEMFLAPWIESLRESGFAGLAGHFSNYNPPYMLLLWLVSLFPGDGLFGVKLISMCFDLFNAFLALRLVGECGGKDSRQLLGFSAVLLFPTFVINGSMWGQCDSIYVFFALAGIYKAMKNRPLMAMLCFAGSLAFKLQAVFVLPVLVVLLLAGKLKLKHFIAFPLCYVLYLLPSVFAGMPLRDALLLYFGNASTVGDALNYNAPSLTAMFRGSSGDPLVPKLLIVAAFLFMLLVLVYAALKRSRLDNKLVLAFAVLLAVGIPFFLPHMHDRYFYAAGMLAVILAAIDWKAAPIALCAEVGSLLCYAAYFLGYYVVHPRWNGVVMLIALLLSALYVIFGTNFSKLKT